MKLPDCVLRLMPNMDGFREPLSDRIEWSIGGSNLDLVLIDDENIVGLCNIEGYRPPMVAEGDHDGARILFDVDKVERMVTIARRLGFQYVSPALVTVNKQENRLFALIGYGSNTAIVLSPYFKTRECDEDE